MNVWRSLWLGEDNPIKPNILIAIAIILIVINNNNNNNTNINNDNNVLPYDPQQVYLGRLEIGSSPSLKP